MQTISLYCKPATPEGKELIKFLKDRGIPFQLNDLDTMSGAYKKLIDQTGQKSQPTTVITTDESTQFIVGLDIQRLNELLVLGP